jgi:hypothetical protein
MQFCRMKGISMTAFEKASGWSPSTIYNLNKGVRSDKLAAAAEAFPDLDVRWLLTGTSGDRPLVVNIGNVDELAVAIGGLLGRS